MKKPFEKCPVCNGIPVQYKFFSHPMCPADSDLVVRATCTRCKPPKKAPDPKDIADELHHKLIGKIKMVPPSQALGKGAQRLRLINDKERNISFTVRPYDPVTHEAYSEILRKIKWNDLTTHYIYPEGRGSCPVKKE